MDETSTSLLDRLREQPDDLSWQRLADLYSPLIRGWLRRYGLVGQDADDQVQEVLLIVFRKLPDFHREPHIGAFRRWLRNITVNCLRNFWRARQGRPAATGDSNFLELLDKLEDPSSELSRLWDQEHDRYITQRLLELIKPNFEATSWQAFQRVALEGAAPDAVAQELGITVNAVFIAKSRVMTRLRKEGEGLLD
jgi:RNA polymerase sigma-70 factor (ECF subfamily)